MSKELKIGLFIIVTIAMVVIGVQYLKGSYIFNNDRVFYGIYDRVQGLTRTNSVTYNGLKVGQVREIALSKNHPGKIAVTIVIENDDFVFSKDSQAKIESTLIGEVSVSILPGKVGVEAENGDTLGIIVSQGFTEAVYSEIEPIKVKALQLISSVDSLLELTRSILDEDARPHLTEGFASMSSGLKSLERSAQKLDGLMASERDKLSGIFTNLQTITDAFAANSGSMSDAIQNFAQISDSLAKVDLASVVKNAGKAVTDVAEIMNKINVGEGSMALLINNDSLHNSLVASSNELTLLLEDMKAHPNRYIHFSVFGKKEKKLRLTQKEADRLQKLLNQTN